MDDPSLPRSLRDGGEIFVNIRSQYWKNYLRVGARSYEEAVVCRFVHEIGHIVAGHTVTPGLKIGSKGIGEEYERRVRQTPAEDILEDLFEKPAWDCVRNIKNNQSQEFDRLLESFKVWHARKSA